MWEIPRPQRSKEIPWRIQFTLSIGLLYRQMLHQSFTPSVMENFLGKYYPGIKRKLHKNRILALEELLEREKLSFKKEYNVDISEEMRVNPQ